MKARLRFLLLFILAVNFGCQNSQNRQIIDSPLGWELFDTPSKASFRGLSPLTEEIAWVSGSGGVWMRTVDGGLTWTSGIIDALDTVDFRDIEGIDASTAIAISAGQPAVIYKTTDGGNSWKKKYQGSEQDFFDGMAFYQDKKGFVIGDPVGGKWTLLKTEDQGETWIPLEIRKEAQEGEAVFAASGSSIHVERQDVWFASGGSVSRIYHTKDGGSKWQVYPTPIIQGDSSQGIFSLTKVDNNYFIGVGGDYLSPDYRDQNVVISDDGGITWRSIDGQHPLGYRSGVTYFPKLHWLIAVGSNGTDFSKDGGKHWEKFSEEPFHAVALDKAKNSIWASGPQGKIGKMNY